MWRIPKVALCIIIFNFFSDLHAHCPSLKFIAMWKFWTGVNSGGDFPFFNLVQSPKTIHAYTHWHFFITSTFGILQIHISFMVWVTWSFGFFEAMIKFWSLQALGRITTEWNVTNIYVMHLSLEYQEESPYTFVQISKFCYIHIYGCWYSHNIDSPIPCPH